MLTREACDTNRPSTWIDVLQARARQYGGKCAFRYLGDNGSGAVELSYEELACRARGIGGRLQAVCGKGERVLLVYPPGIDYVAAFFGCLYSGNLAVPVFPPRPYRPSVRLATILRDAQPAAVLSNATLCDTAPQRYSQIPQLLDIPWLATDSLAAGSEREWADPPVKPADVAFLQYTSGSTGEPKGVMVTHANLLHNSAAIRRVFGTMPDDRGVCWLPLYHDMGLIGGILQPIYAGASSVLMSAAAVMQSPLQWLQAVSQSRATISGGPDFAYDHCCRKIGPEAKADLDLSSWRVAFSGAEPVRAETMKRFADAFAVCGFRREAFFPCYGLAEATLLVSGGEPAAAPRALRCDAESLAEGRVAPAGQNGRAARLVVSCGRSIPDQQIAIVDPRSRQACEPEGVGEVWVAGPSVASGYYNAPAATEKTFHARPAGSAEGPFLRTGDLGFLKDGELFITGRLKDLIIIRGCNYYPQDIERTVQECHPRLRPSAGAAFALEVAGSERLVIVQELERHHRELVLEDVFTAIRRAVCSEYDLEPYVIVLLKTGGVPKTSSGKIRRSRCREDYLTGRLEMVGHWKQPSSNGRHALSVDDATASPDSSQPVARILSPKELQGWLAQRLSLRLGVPQPEIQADKPFADYGLTSMQIVVLTEELERWIGRQVSPTFFFHYPTIATLAMHLAKLRSAPQPPAAVATQDDEALCAASTTEVENLSDDAIVSLVSREMEELP